MEPQLLLYRLLVCVGFLQLYLAMCVARFSEPESADLLVKFKIVLVTFAVTLADIHLSLLYVFLQCVEMKQNLHLIHLLLPKMASPIVPSSEFEKIIEGCF